MSHLFRLAILGSLFFGLSKANALCVVSAKASLRSGPGAKFPVTWTVGKYMPLAEVKSSGGWIQVEDIDGETHWISAANVSRKMVCLAVKTPVAKLHSGPGIQAELADIRQVDRYTPFKRVDLQDEWSQVEASWGETYWLHESATWRPSRVKKFNF